jgi:uncharacterized membrane protein YhaH (DUF805 family)
VLVKRIHDRNKSGWLVWLLYGPLIVALIFTIIAVIASVSGERSTAWASGIVAGLAWLMALVAGIWFFIEFGCLRGTIGHNRFGADPVPRG